jgi:hypothetical protein
MVSLPDAECFSQIITPESGCARITLEFPEFRQHLLAEHALPPGEIENGLASFEADQQRLNGSLGQARQGRDCDQHSEVAERQITYQPVGVDRHE